MNAITIILPQIADGEDKSSPFVNCLRNNYRHLRKWAKRTFTDSFRLYDRDLSNYPIAIDFYAGRFCVHYYSPKRAMEEPAAEFIEEVNHSLSMLFAASADAIFWRIRSRDKETRQYEKVENAKDFFVVYEYGIKFKVNLLDYLDTGLFLDHRETRRFVASLAHNKRVLNLFAYTCSFSVHAAVEGATFTKSVDMSNTYAAWGRDNFVLNGFSRQNHVIVREDCLQFLYDEIRSSERYDLIIIDPPTISRSKKMSQLFDIQKDHVDLIRKSMRLLSPGGVIIFSTNFRKFQMDASLLNEYQVVDITPKTMPIDFRDKHIHRCWKIESVKVNNL